MSVQTLNERKSTERDLQVIQAQVLVQVQAQVVPVVAVVHLPLLPQKVPVIKIIGLVERVMKKCHQLPILEAIKVVMVVVV